MKITSKSIFSLVVAASLAFPAVVRAESIWPTTGGGNHSMFADHKAAGAGDIVTILVQETAAATSTQTKASNRESSLSDAVSSFLFSPAASGLGTHKGELPAASWGGKSSYTGGGSVNNSQSLTARAAVLVSDVLPNGNFVIEGVRVVKFSGETQYVVLRGVIRPDDITPDNVILSTNIADARVEFYSEGSLTDAQKRGWLTKLYEK
ncbi:MAG TPA: flagellar basal body L-ring protein FlgH, partial [Opitutus sp.]|nr:flagellar basal body L-ring protein FlgH [Opitutus sp.]